jgi:hypothetical protein
MQWCQCGRQSCKSAQVSERTHRRHKDEEHTAIIKQVRAEQTQRNGSYMYINIYKYIYISLFSFFIILQWGKSITPWRVMIYFLCVCLFLGAEATQLRAALSEGTGPVSAANVRKLYVYVTTGRAL